MALVWTAFGCGGTREPTALNSVADAHADAVGNDGSPKDAADAWKRVEDATGPSDTTPVDAQRRLDTSDAVSDARITYRLDDVLRLSHLQAKGTHNSYHINPNPLVADWNYNHASLDVQLAEYGVRQVELDVHYQSDGTWAVFHLPTLDDDSTCATLTECLETMKEWSDTHPAHHLLFILIEPKDEFDAISIAGHYDELDQAILSVWPRDRTLLPDDVRGEHVTLRAALEEKGWPTLGETRGKAMFVMLDGGDHRDAYLDGHPTLEDRVLFARGGVGEPYGAVLEYGNPAGQEEEIAERIAAGYLVRAHADDPTDSDEENAAHADAARASGAHFISSDFPAEREGYFFDLPGGNPSRCNPVAAPETCASTDIESL